MKCYPLAHRIIQPATPYKLACETDVRATFKRIRKEQAAVQAGPFPLNVQPLKRKQS